jgi:hypothetical protein
MDLPDPEGAHGQLLPNLPEPAATHRAAILLAVIENAYVHGVSTANWPTLG